MLIIATESYNGCWNNLDTKDWETQTLILEFLFNSPNKNIANITKIELYIKIYAICGWE